MCTRRPPGHGTTDAAKGGAGVADFAAATGDVLDGRRLRKVDVFGYELGAQAPSADRITFGGSSCGAFLIPGATPQVAASVLRDSSTAHRRLLFEDRTECIAGRTLVASTLLSSTEGKGRSRCILGASLAALSECVGAGAVRRPTSMPSDAVVLVTIGALGLIVVVLSAATAILLRRLSRTLEQKRRSDSRYRTVIEQAGDGILLVDAHTGLLLEANSSLRRRLGYSAEEIPGLKIEDVLIETDLSQDTLGSMLRDRTRSNARSLKQRCKNGQLLDVEVSVSRLEIDGRPALCYIAHDVTERKNVELELLRNQRRLDHLAHHDSLTGLPNRLRLRSYLEEALAACDAGEALAVMLLDLDNFKIINDSRGHNIGDELLVEVARQLVKLVQGRGIVARLGGDEFVVVLRGIRDRDAVQAAATEILNVINGPLQVAGRTITTSVSIGITLCPQDARELDAVLREADLAMYTAKERGRSNVQFFAPEMNARVRKRVTMEHALREALQAKQFVVHYHPLVAIASRRIVGLEALVRWEHPRRGQIPPAKFIPVAEDSGLIVPLGEHILRTVCEQMGAWQGEGVPVVPVAVNWSAMQLERQSVVDVVRGVVEETRIDPHLLALEITEGTLMRDAEQHARALQVLRDAGIRIQIDDFGTGYSSLSYLRELPIDTLKIDRSFISHLDESPADRAIVSAVLAMAGSLGLRVVAEGVETAAQLEVLSSQGCEVAQGFFFSRPLPADQCRTLLEELAIRPSFTETVRMRLRNGYPEIEPKQVHSG